MFLKGNDFTCQHHNQLECVSEGGAIFFFVYNIILYCFSFLIWGVFYKIPEQHGLVAQTRAVKVGHQTVSLHRSTMDSEMLMVGDLIKMNKDDSDFLHLHHLQSINPDEKTLARQKTKLKSNASDTQWTVSSRQDQTESEEYNEEVISPKKYGNTNRSSVFADPENNAIQRWRRQKSQLKKQTINSTISNTSNQF